MFRNDCFDYWSLVIGHWSLVIGHWLLVIGHWSLGIGDWVKGHWAKGHWYFFLVSLVLLVCLVSLIPSPQS
ncbi:hypothetical protein F7734_57950 [Scytonema sp. UIC 10036]|nr:hypothetical protein [Scytonema sp. UIC 10036]